MAGTGVFQIPIPVFGGSDAGTGTFQVPNPTLTGYGSTDVPVFTIPMAVVTGICSWTGGNASLVVPSVIISGVGQTGGIGTGIFRIPTATILGGAGSHGSGLFNIPIVHFGPQIYGGSGSFIIPFSGPVGYGVLVPITKVYQGIAMNIMNKAISTYRNFAFNSMAYFNGKYLGANDDGIYIIGGNTDMDARINAKLVTGPVDFKTDRLQDVWLTYRADGHLAIVLYVDEDTNARTCDLPTAIAGNEIHEEKVKTPRGLAGRFYTIEIKNLSGSDFDLKQISAAVESFKRQVRRRS